MRVLVVGRGRSALAAVRALGVAGHWVGVGCSEANPATVSRWTRRREDVRSPAHDRDGFAADISTACRERSYDAVVGAGDTEVIALSLDRSRISAHVPYPPHEVVIRCFDKLELYLAAGRSGLRAPATVEATPSAVAALKGPTVVKARWHWVPGMTTTSDRIEARVASDKREARQLVDAIRRSGGTAILQEKLVGSLLSYALVLDEQGRVVGHVQQKADHTWPPGMGVSTRAITIPVDETLAEQAASLLQSLGWFGLAQLQFLQAGDGEPCLLDFNGRYYGSMPLATAAGVNLPALGLNMGAAKDRSSSGAVGVRFQWLEGDLRRAWKERRGGLFADLTSCLRFRREADAHGVWDPRDPAPAFRGATDLMARLIRWPLKRGGGIV